MLIISLLLVVAACKKSVPEGMLPVVLEKNPNFSNYSMYRFDDGGVVQGSPITYWIYLPENSPSLLHSRVISKDGSIDLYFSGPGVENQKCEQLKEQGIFGCGINAKNMVEGEYFFQIQPASEISEKYNLYISYRSKFPLDSIE